MSNNQETLTRTTQEVSTPDPAWEHLTRHAEFSTEELGMSERDYFYVVQMLVRFAEKSYPQQQSDAVFADLIARGIEEYDPDPREEARAYVDNEFLYLFYDWDSPWETPEHLQPQFDLFDELDNKLPVRNWVMGSEHLSTDHEPSQYPPIAVEDQWLEDWLTEFQARRQLADASGKVYSVAELVQYCRDREKEIAKHANDRINRIRGDK